MTSNAVLVTGSTGYLGSLLLQKLFEQRTDHKLKIVALDIRPVPEEKRLEGIVYLTEDIRSPKLVDLFKQYEIKTVVHLAAIVSPPKNSTREFLQSVEVDGTKNVLDACTAASTKRFIVTSSGAAYGYHSDNPEWLTENDPIRGNYEFPYSYHKRLVEEMLVDYRTNQPELEQTIFRVGTIFGASTNNQITALFDKSIQIAVKGSDSPFVFIWDQDMVEILYTAIFTDQSGIYNVAGDGALKIHEIADRLGKKIIQFPPWFLKALLFILKKVGLSQYGPEQVRFLQFRPVLLNTKLKKEFGYKPMKTSSEVFDFYLSSRK